MAKKTGVPQGSGSEDATEFDPFDAGPDGGQAIEARVYLVARTGDRTRIVDLDDGAAMTFGRAEDADVCLDDRRVSRHHARIERKGRLVTVTDLGSRNGTKLNQLVLRESTERAASGDVIRLGGTEIVVAVAAEDEPDGAQDSLTDEVVVAEPAMMKVFQMARRLAAVDSPVLISGETGVGKEIVARQMHRWSKRAKGPFVRLSCASVAPETLDIELFGQKGGEAGRLAEARGGTLLIDEIGELPATAQAKLLRALESDDAEVRFLCTAQRDLKADADEGRFRGDLFYRISAFRIQVPPLRGRPAEIALFAELFARRFAEEMGMPKLALGPEVLGALALRPWPGNVRELRSAIEQAMVLADGAPLTPDHLAAQARTANAAAASAGPMRDRLEEMERKSIEDALAAEKGNQTRAAKRLGVSRRTLVYKLQKYGIGR